MLIFLDIWIYLLSAFAAAAAAAAAAVVAQKWMQRNLIFSPFPFPHRSQVPGSFTPFSQSVLDSPH